MSRLARGFAALVDWAGSATGERVQALLLVGAALIGARWIREEAARVEQECTVRDEVLANVAMLGYATTRLQVAAEREGRHVAAEEIERLFALQPAVADWLLVYPDCQPALRNTVAGPIFVFESIVHAVPSGAGR